jgi:hypothetical protein
MLTCVLGRDTIFLLDFDQHVGVEGYNPALGMKTPTPPLVVLLLMMTYRPVRYIT